MSFSAWSVVRAYDAPKAAPKVAPTPKKAGPNKLFGQVLYHPSSGDAGAKGKYKVWEIEMIEVNSPKSINDHEVIVRWGREGAIMQEKVIGFAGYNRASREYSKLLDNKMRTGYSRTKD